MKMTAKYKTALQTARPLGFAAYATQDELYHALNNAGFWWDSKAQKWVEFKAEPADAPCPQVRIRVWAEEGEPLNKAKALIKGAFANGYKKIVESEHYPCRPPKQLESRVYLEFLPTGEMSQDELIKENDPYAIEIEG